MNNDNIVSGNLHGITILCGIIEAQRCCTGPCRCKVEDGYLE